MSEISYKIPKHPVFPTILLLMVGATVGALFGCIAAFIASNVGLAMGGPLAMLVLAPLLFAMAGLGIAFVIIVTPLWALIGGSIFARLSSGKGGSAAKTMGLTFFSEEHPIAQTARRMTDKLGMYPLAFIGWYDSDDINAFAMGTDPENSLVGLSKGAIETLTAPQLDAVIAHELGHVASNDMARMTYALGIREALTFFLLFQGLKKTARWVFTPLSELELLRFSRKREFTADAISAHLTSPEAIISALERVQGQTEEPQTRGQAVVMMSAAFDNTWLSTHPPLADRIAALRKLATNGVQEVDSVPS